MRAFYHTSSNPEADLKMTDALRARWACWWEWWRGAWAPAGRRGTLFARDWMDPVLSAYLAVVDPHRAVRRVRVLGPAGDNAVCRDEFVLAGPAAVRRAAGVAPQHDRLASRRVVGVGAVDHDLLLCNFENAA